MEGPSAGQLYMAPELAKLFESRRESLAKESGDSFVTIERLLQALAQRPRAAPPRERSTAAGVTPAGLDQAIQQLRRGRTAQSCQRRGRL